MVKKNKKLVFGVVGGVSAFLGGVGVFISGFGLCACVLVPFFSFIGFVSMLVFFLSNYKFLFLVVGLVFLFLSFVLYKNKGSCRVHGKVRR